MHIMCINNNIDEITLFGCPGVTGTNSQMMCDPYELEEAFQKTASEDEPGVLIMKMNTKCRQVHTQNNINMSGSC
jgi:hypothetical protein